MLTLDAFVEPVRCDEGIDYTVLLVINDHREVISFRENTLGRRIRIENVEGGHLSFRTPHAVTVVSQYGRLTATVIIHLNKNATEVTEITSLEVIYTVERRNNAYKRILYTGNGFRMKRQDDMSLCDDDLYGKPISKLSEVPF